MGPFQELFSLSLSPSLSRWRQCSGVLNFTCTQVPARVPERPSPALWHGQVTLTHTSSSEPGENHDFRLLVAEQHARRMVERRVRIGADFPGNPKKGAAGESEMRFGRTVVVSGLTSSISPQSSCSLTGASPEQRHRVGGGLAPGDRRSGQANPPLPKRWAGASTGPSGR